MKLSRRLLLPAAIEMLLSSSALADGAPTAETSVCVGQGRQGMNGHSARFRTTLEVT
jgi:hypothetical protein